MAQQTMYPAIVNSPQTELAADISDSDTTFDVLNGAALPAAPNLATIGNDETAETILYTSLTGNTMSGVTRGFQGNAKSWSAGAKVARMFTAYDYEAMRNNIGELAKIGTKFKDIPEPFYIAHRGGANVFPENTIEAYRGSLALGIKMIEQDCRQLLDGSLGVMHDSTVDRITDKTGDVASFSTMGWSNTNVSGLLPGWKDVPLTTFEQVLQTFGKSAVYVPESKDQQSAQAIVNALKKHGLEEYALVQSFSLSDLEEASGQGISLMLLTDSTSPATIAAAGIEYVGVSANATDAYIESAINAGLKVVVWTIDRRYLRDHYLTLGVSGFFSNDPYYLSGQSPALRSDPFANQVYFHGHISPPGGPTGDGTISLGGHRGNFYLPNKFGWKTVGFRIKEVSLQGWAGELPTSFTLTYDMTYESDGGDADAAKPTRWGSVAICSPIDFFNDAVDDSSGYNILQRVNGQLQIYRVDSSVATLLDTYQGSTLTIGQTVSLSIQVDGDEITVTRVGEGSVTVTDTVYRNGYMSIISNYAGTTFANMIITED